MNYRVLKYITDYIYVPLVSNTKQNSSLLILEPIMTIFKLAMLSFSPDGTKISIQNNNIFLQTTDALQGVKRYSNGDKSNDLHNLCYPIRKIHDFKILFDQNDYDIIVNLACNGLEKLKKTYKNNDMIIQAISSYQSILRNIYDKRYYRRDSDSDKEIEGENENDYNFDIYKKFIDIWDKYELKMLCHMFIIANKKRDNNKGDDSDTILQAINIILDQKGKTVTSILENIHK